VAPRNAAAGLTPSLLPKVAKMAAGMGSARPIRRLWDWSRVVDGS